MESTSITVKAMVVVLLTTSTVSANLSDGLVAYYPFNGNANDETSNGHDGTVYGATLTTDRFGNPNSAYSFNDTTDYIALSNAQDFAFGGSFSVSLWGTVAENTNTYDPFIWIGGPSAGTPDFTIMKSRSGWSEGRLYAQVLPPKTEVFSTATGAEIPTNEWLHMVAIVDQSTDTLSFYVNDALQGTNNIWDFDLSSVSPLYANIGRDTWTSGADYHYGLIDDVRVYNRTLTASEVHDLYVIPAPGAIILAGIGVACVTWLRRCKVFAGV